MMTNLMSDMVPTSNVRLEGGTARHELTTRARLTLESRRKQMRNTSGRLETGSEERRASGSEEDSEMRNFVLLLAAKWILCCSSTSAEFFSAG